MVVDNKSFGKAIIYLLFLTSDFKNKKKYKEESKIIYNPAFRDTHF